LGGVWVSLTVGLVGVVGTMATAVAYRMREAARRRWVTDSAQALPRGGSVRYRSVDRQGRATAEWELIIPAQDDRTLGSGLSDSEGTQ
jgi:hypothetical protein